jgi:hypothetical protein
MNSSDQTSFVPPTECLVLASPASTQDGATKWIMILSDYVRDLAAHAFRVKERRTLRFAATTIVSHISSHRDRRFRSAATTGPKMGATTTPYSAGRRRQEGTSSREATVVQGGRSWGPNAQALDLAPQNFRTFGTFQVCRTVLVGFWN